VYKVIAYVLIIAGILFLPQLVMAIFFGGLCLWSVIQKYK